MTGILHALEWINKYIFSPLLPILIFGAGIYFAFSLRFFCITHPVKFLRVFFPKKEKELKRDKDSISPFKAVTLALAGTLGVGNIIGVSAAIMTGGFGSIFWMWCSAIAAMMVKYAEIVLAVKSRIKLPDDKGVEKFHGGAMYYIKNGIFAAIFASLCIASSFFLGNIIQVKAAADAINSTFGVPPLIVGCVIALLCAIIIGGGVHNISDFTVKIIPVLSALYIAASLYIIIINGSRIPEAIHRIFADAFTPEASIGGIGGFLLCRSMRYGITRGLFSNEAGCGTAPIAHAEADTKHPAAQGCWGIFEVFTDTILLCSMTAFVVIFAFDSVGQSCITDTSGMLLAVKAYSLYLGDSAGMFISLSTAIFALATLVCWSHYGLEGVWYISRIIKKKRNTPINFGMLRNMYIILYCVAAAIGGILSGDIIWAFSDFAVGIMTCMNIAAVMKNRKEITLETKSYFEPCHKYKTVLNHRQNLSTPCQNHQNSNHQTHQNLRSNHHNTVKNSLQPDQNF